MKTRGCVRGGADAEGAADADDAIAEVCVLACGALGAAIGSADASETTRASPDGAGAAAHAHVETTTRRTFARMSLQRIR